MTALLVWSTWFFPKLNILFILFHVWFKSHHIIFKNFWLHFITLKQKSFVNWFMICKKTSYNIWALIFILVCKDRKKYACMCMCVLMHLIHTCFYGVTTMWQVSRIWRFPAMLAFRSSVKLLIYTSIAQWVSTHTLHSSETSSYHC